MLLVAMPKTASTSFAHTLAEVLNVRKNQVLLRPSKLPAADGFPWLSKYHSDCRRWPEDDVRHMIDAPNVYKQHLPPASVCSSDYVLLVREPVEIIGAYGRTSKVVTDPGGLADELTRFMWGHLANGPRLVLSYDMIITNPRRALAHVIDAWGLDVPIKPDVELAKLRYTR